MSAILLIGTFFKPLKNSGVKYMNLRNTQIPGRRIEMEKEFVTGLVSVVIPAYQSAWCISETLDSVISQTYKNIEIIVVDDGSTDDTCEIINKKYKEKVKIVSKKNNGLAGARNTGLLLSNGEYIQFLDSDDLLDSTKIEKQVNFFIENKNISCVTCSYYEFIGNINNITKAKQPDISSIFPDIMFRNVVGAVHGPLIRRDALAAVGGFDEDFKNYCADWELWLSMVFYGIEFAQINENLVYYRRHPESLTRKNIYPNCLGDLKVVQRGADYARGIGLARVWRVREALELRFLECARWAAKEQGIMRAFPFFFQALRMSENKKLYYFLKALNSTRSKLK